MASVTNDYGSPPGLHRATARPVQPGKLASTASVLSAGRMSCDSVRLAEEDFDLVGPTSARGARFDEMLESCACSGAGRWSSFHGRFYDFDRQMSPPAVGGRLPILLAETLNEPRARGTTRRVDRVHRDPGDAALVRRCARCDRRMAIANDPSRLPPWSFVARLRPRHSRAWR